MIPVPIVAFFSGLICGLAFSLIIIDNKIIKGLKEDRLKMYKEEYLAAWKKDFENNKMEAELYAKLTANKILEEVKNAIKST